MLNDQVRAFEEIERLRGEIKYLKSEVKSAQTSPSSVSRNSEVKQIIEKWREQSKPTRDWTKCNQLISELEKLIN